MTAFTRRELLQSAVVVSGASAVASGGGAANPIPEPYDAIPTIDDPTPRERRYAENQYPPRAVPGVGAVPDHRYQHTPECEFHVPEWALAAVEWRLSHCDDPTTVSTTDVEGYLFDYAYIREDFRTPDGRDAVDVLLSRLSE